MSNEAHPFPLSLFSLLMANSVNFLTVPRGACSILICVFSVELSDGLSKQCRERESVADAVWFRETEF